MKIVLVQGLVQQATQTDILNTTTKTNRKETTFLQVNTKRFVVGPHFLPHITTLKLGYKSWGVTDLPP
jgi:hypothetical protein